MYLEGFRRRNVVFYKDFATRNTHIAKKIEIFFVLVAFLTFFVSVPQGNFYNKSVIGEVLYKVWYLTFGIGISNTKDDANALQCSDAVPDESESG